MSEDQIRRELHELHGLYRLALAPPALCKRETDRQTDRDIDRD